MKKKETEFLTDEEAQAILRVPDRRTLQGKRDYAILITLLTSGLRKAELCNLKVGDLKTYRNQAVINVIGKGQKFRRIPAEIGMIGMAQAFCSLSGTFLRGGIATGLFAYQDDILVSQAMVEAYRIESEIMEVPLIGMTEEQFSLFVPRIQSIIEKDNRNPFGENFFYLKRKNPKQSILAINYLKIGFGLFGWMYREGDNEIGPPFLSSQKEFLRKHAKAVRKGLKLSPNHKIRKKYEYLVRYHNKFVSLLGTDFNRYRICV